MNRARYGIGTHVWRMVPGGVMNHRVDAVFYGDDGQVSYMLSGHGKEVLECAVHATRGEANEVMELRYGKPNATN